MNADLEQELEDYRALLETPGWKRFVNTAFGQFGPEGYRRAARKILASKVDPALMAQQLLHLEATASDIENLVRYPAERVKALTHRESGERPAHVHDFAAAREALR